MAVQKQTPARSGAISDRELTEELGTRKPLWDQLVAVLKEEYKLVEEWNYSKKWSLRLKRGKRNIVYLLPSPQAIQASFALGGKAVEQARKELPPAVVQVIDAAPRYAEGTGVRLAVNEAADIAVIQKLARIKLEN